ncbi:hypothetical protein ACTFIU_001919 [Dictyostelium citrinum]
MVVNLERNLIQILKKKLITTKNTTSTTITTITTITTTDREYLVHKQSKWNLISKLGEGSHVADVFNKPFTIFIQPTTFNKCNTSTSNKTFIPLSVTDLSLDFGFDIIENGDNLPINSITTFRSGYKFTKPINQRYLPQ